MKNKTSKETSARIKPRTQDEIVTTIVLSDTKWGRAFNRDLIANKLNNLNKI